MNCPRCGEVCRCHSEPPPAETAAPASESRSVLTPQPPLAGEVRAESPDPPDFDQTRSVDKANSSPVDAASPAEDSAWRQELAARLDRYRARRKVRPPRYPSLHLRVDAVQARTGTTPVIPRHEYEPVSNHALALDAVSTAHPEEHTASPDSSHCDSPPPTEASTAAHSGAKIIEFPRFAWGPPPPPPDQLAEPVTDRPRILEAPEGPPPPPALGGITIEPSQRQELEKRPGIDFPLQGASFPRRVIAAGLDGLIIAAASALFGLIFWKVAAILPPEFQLLGLAAGVPCLFWAIYNYLLIVYAGCTPGLRAAGLELVRFDGTATTRPLRRWRVLASYLSAASLGMGYVWAFLDEDSLCWHDRITHTYLAPEKRAATEQR